MSDTETNAKLRQRISDLQGRLNDTQEKCDPKSKFPSIAMMITAAVIPVVIFLALYFGKPGFVQSLDEKTGKFVVSNTKIALYTTGITLVCWAVLYVYTYCDSWMK